MFGVSEDAAQKRLTRALDRLRAHFRRRGLEASAAFVAAALGTAGSQAAPAGMAVAVAAGSVSAGGAASATLIGQWLAHLPSSITLMKTPIITTALVAATVSVSLVYQEYERSQLSRKGPNYSISAFAWPFTWACFQPCSLALALFHVPICSRPAPQNPSSGSLRPGS